MPFLYVYSPSDFVGGLPSEAGGAANGTPSFTLTLVAGATPTLIEITDDDLVFDEIDGSQVLTNAVNLDGTNYAAGTTAHSSYDLINTTSGHKVTGVHFGGDGYQQGAIQGLISTVEMVPGTSYTFNTERTSHQKNNLYDDYFACFVAGSHIDTEYGERPVEELEQGDLVRTGDGVLRPLRLILHRHLRPEELERAPGLRPVRIMAGSLGAGLPKRDLLVSPQHRMLVKSIIARRMVGADEVFVSARKLSALPGVFTEAAPEGLTYYHLVFDQHEVIFAEGAPTESFYCGPNALQALSQESREEMDALFPGLMAGCDCPESARPILDGARQKRLMMRHVKNAKPVLETL